MCVMVGKSMEQANDPMLHAWTRQKGVTLCRVPISGHKCHRVPDRAEVPGVPACRTAAGDIGSILIFSRERQHHVTPHTPWQCAKGWVTSR